MHVDKDTHTRARTQRRKTRTECNSDELTCQALCRHSRSCLERQEPAPWYLCQLHCSSLHARKEKKKGNLKLNYNRHEARGRFQVKGHTKKTTWCVAHTRTHTHTYKQTHTQKRVGQCFLLLVCSCAVPDMREC